MECKDCAESTPEGLPGGSCCAMCAESIYALDPPLDWDDEERVVSALEAGHGIRVDLPGRRYYKPIGGPIYSEQIDAFADHLELAGALELLKDRDKRIAELEAALDDVLTYVEKYTRMVNTDPGRLQRARASLARGAR